MPRSQISYPEETMKESNLAKAIDRAAKQRAHAIIKKIRTAIIETLQKHWRPKEVGEEFIGDDITRLLKTMADAPNAMREVSFVPSSEMLAACRAAIINDLLNGLPQLRELAKMAEDEDHG